MKKSPAASIRIILYIAVFTALYIAFSYPLRSMGLPFHFGFVAIAVCAAVMDPVFAMLTAFIGDLIGTIMVSPAGYFPGYGVTALLGALIYGIFFHKSKIIFAKQYSPKAFFLIFAGCLLSVMLEVLTTPAWQTLQSTQIRSFVNFQTGYISRLPDAIPVAAIFLPIQIVILNIIFKLFRRPILWLWQKL